MALPLSGIKVINLSPWFPSLYVTFILADLGADVILIEDPAESGRVKRAHGAESIINRNKRSLTLNLKTKKGGEIFFKLIPNCDVIIEGFRTGVAERLGIDYAAIKRTNSKTIYCSMPGYAHDSPYSDYPAFNYNFMGICGALAGMSDINHNIWVADLAAAMFAAIGIMAALRERERVGKGQYIEVPMFDSMLACMAMPLGIYFATGKTPRTTPAINIYRTADGRAITLNVGPQEKFWQKLCSAIGQEKWIGLSSLERAERREEIETALKNIILERTRDEWVRLFEPLGIPFGPVLALEEVCKQPYILNQNLIIEIEDNKGEKIKQIMHPIRFSEISIKIRIPSPSPGENTEEVLQDIGYSRDQIKELRKESVI